MLSPLATKRISVEVYQQYLFCDSESPAQTVSGTHDADLYLYDAGVSLLIHPTVEHSRQIYLTLSSATGLVSLLYVSPEGVEPCFKSRYVFDTEHPFANNHFLGGGCLVLRTETKLCDFDVSDEGLYGRITYNLYSAGGFILSGDLQIRSLGDSIWERDAAPQNLGT